MKKILKKSLIFTLGILLLLSSVLQTPVQAEAAVTSTLVTQTEGYIDYKQGIKDVYQGEAIVFDVEGVVSIEYGNSATFNVMTQQAGHYYLNLEYEIPNEKVLPTTLEIRVNQQFLYDELRNVTLQNKWHRDETPVIDRYDNEIVPDVNQVKGVQETFIYDSSGREREPLLVYLEAGSNTVSLTSIEGDILISNLQAMGQKDAVKRNYGADKVGELEGDQYIYIEAETPTLQNSPSTRPGSWFNMNLTPYDTKLKKLNYLDGLSFKEALQYIEYEFEVEESGQYHLGFRYLQDAKVDFSVFADILIDDEIVSESLENYKFEYVTNFSDMIVHNEEGNLIFDLEKGTHTLKIVLRVDELQDILNELETIVSEVQQLSITIKNLVGNVVDKNRNFEILEYIPDVESQLTGWADQLDAIYKAAQALEGTTDNVSAFSSLKIAEKQLRSIASKQREIHIRVNELATGTNSITAYLGTVLEGMTNNGLSIDKMFFIQDKDNVPKRANIFAKTVDSVVRFFTSFGDQSYEINDEDSDSLQVWVNRPRQYIEILQNIIDKEFTPATGTKVQLSIMPDANKLVLANAAGTAPDVALGLNYALPFDLAIRGALLDLSEFDEFESVAKQYPEQLIVPSMIGDAVYAMPETMNFYVLFYRKDVMDNIGLEVFDTMDDVVQNLPILHQQGLNFFYPTAGMASMKIFAGTMPIIYQNGGNFYGDTIERTAFNSQETIAGFKQLTDLFTIYNIPYDVPSFYQQFRDGSIPVGIADYGAYNLITNAAPEIANLWDIALMPGYEDENGEVLRYSSGGAESSVIFSDTEMKDASWEFMQWWSSASVQSEFGTALQTSFGKEYMWNTANLEAFSNLPWKTQHKEVILAQADWIVEVPRVLGTYMLEREVSNAYNSVVLDGEDIRRAIDLSTKRINRETNRKLEEFGYLNENRVYKTPKIEDLWEVKGRD